MSFFSSFLHFAMGYLNLSFDKGGNVVLILKDGERLQQVMFQPLPVLCDLFAGGSCRSVEGQKNPEHESDVSEEMMTIE